MANVIREGRTHYCTATKAVAHAAPCTEQGFTGTAIKKLAPAAGVGLGDSTIQTVAIGEKFHIELKGSRELTNARKEGGTFAVGDKVYIDPADNALTAVTTNNLKYGLVEEIAGGRHLPSGSPLMVVNLDAKNQF